jgi:hypothetical protein
MVQHFTTTWDEVFTSQSALIKRMKELKEQHLSHPYNKEYKIQSRKWRRNYWDIEDSRKDLLNPGPLSVQFMQA